MKKNKFLMSLIISLTITSMLSLSGCSLNKDSATNNNQVNTLGQNNHITENTTFGKVSEINGNNITFEVGTIGRNDKSNSQDSAPPDMPSGDNNNSQGNTPPEMPSDNGSAPTGNAQSGQAPNRQSPQNDGATDDQAPSAGQAQNGNSMRGKASPSLSLTGESKTITITDESIISNKGNDNSSSGLSSIKVGDIIKITYTDDTNETISSIEIMKFSTGTGTSTPQNIPNGTKNATSTPNSSKSSI